MLSCPKGCSRQFRDEPELYHHLRDAHRIGEVEARRLTGLEAGGSGWYETKQNTPEGEKAIDHSIAAAKAAVAASAPLKVPIIPMEKKPEVTVAKGWKRAETGYYFEKVIAETHTIDNYIIQILKGNIKGNHGTLTLWIYDKDISELSSMQEKAGILDAKLTSYIPADPEWVTISDQLHDLLYRIGEKKKELAPKVFNEVKLEDTYHGNDSLGEYPYEKWVSDFMVKANEEAERVEAEINKRDPTKLR